MMYENAHSGQQNSLNPNSLQALGRLNQIGQGTGLVEYDRLRQNQQTTPVQAVGLVNQPLYGYQESSLRLEALKLAHDADRPSNVIERAEAYLKFLRGG
jgi:hypothetical protein